jgi:hypothetical protein
LNAGGEAEGRKRRGSGTLISLNKTVNLIDIKMNWKKHKKMTKGPINVETKVNMKKSMKANTELNMSMNMDMKKKVNSMLPAERWRCSFAGYPCGQINRGCRRGPLLDEASEGLPR